MNQNCFQPLDPKDFDQLFDLLEQSFPPQERRNYKGHATLLNDPAYRVYVDKAEDGLLRAFITVWQLDGFQYVEHFAVNPLIRGGGLGSKMLTHLLSQSTLPTILEVEPPDEEMAVRRIGFYQRLGFHLNEYDYMQPPMQEGMPYIPLMIMSYPSPISKEIFEKCKAQLYTRVYKAPTP